MRDIQEIRYRNFQFLLEECASLLGQARGAAALLSTRSGVPRSLISMLASKAVHSDTGKRRQIGDDTANKFETGMGKDPGWMDVDRSAAKDYREAAHLDRLRLLSQSQRDAIDRMVEEFLRAAAPEPPPGPVTRSD